MTERSIVITGASGIIGKVLREGLGQYPKTYLDLPETDVTDLSKLQEIFPGNFAVIHLAWDTKTDNFRSGKTNPDNAVMFSNVYKAAIESKVKRVIMASSIHADDCENWQGRDLIKVDRTPIPDSPYGAHKVYMEALGRFYATKGLEVICLRFGAVNPQNLPPEDEEIGKAVWLSHQDCEELVKKCLEAESVPSNFLIIYAVSNNTNRIHDISNPLGWTPFDNAEIASEPPQDK